MTVVATTVVVSAPAEAEAEAAVRAGPASTQTPTLTAAREAATVSEIFVAWVYVTAVCDDVPWTCKVLPLIAANSPVAPGNWRCRFCWPAEADPD
jgi:hypothetical protein